MLAHLTHNTVASIHNTTDNLTKNVNKISKLIANSSQFYYRLQYCDSSFFILSYISKQFTQIIVRFKVVIQKLSFTFIYKG